MRLPEPAATRDIGIGPRALVVGDWNGDGKPDLAVADERASELRILFCAGDGSFEDGPRYDVPYSPRAVYAADLNGDGKADLIWRNGDGTYAAWTMNGMSLFGGGYLLNGGSGWEMSTLP